MTLHLIVATVLILAAGWALPGPIARATGLPSGAVAILCTVLLFGVGVVLMWLMDAYGHPLRFTDPTEEGAFLFSAVALCIPGCVALATRTAMLKGKDT
ncbi:hypothetical protein [uncultured Tateyamaria sp.]|uniref:hypothetical protein n=1 Tax=Tateyamaria sp. 1078 TaxID=3417464 RepID=UPI0026367B60|nr:hypothetical protein [uncultured Tateyamaria sp.]